MKHVKFCKSKKKAFDPITKNPLEFEDKTAGFFGKTHFKKYRLSKQKLFKDRHPLIADKMVTYLWPENDLEPVGIIALEKYKPSD